MTKLKCSSCVTDLKGSSDGGTVTSVYSVQGAAKKVILSYIANF